MVRQPSVDAALDGPPGSFCVAKADSDGQRWMWFVLPGKGGCGCIRLRPLRPSHAGEPSWEWDGNEDKPTLTPSVNCVDIWHGFFTAGRMVSC
jgi:hypothetical protein